ncbi:hypothetical protein QKU48_gp0548 [Fadolivirus algeromassiliense]|jgi:hypothetical protein|uniref:OTU domain-containing protein n=1 Tax=Fadolivirus FV1/VV64 TaxID=3070911 RepID=A0A7D3QVT1_9VIRU|nr:hypothetical protein QKU48_gp0548 [Fadolivirus algeromassiliense]QKF94006.1 hypothetical protein Fadolivirus_1_548 [Fadolivirus FV1/VV64]
MENILYNIKIIYNRKDIIDAILNKINIKKEEPLNVYRINEKDAKIANNVRNYVRNESKLLTENEELIEIIPDGHCLFRALGKLIYNKIDNDTTFRVRREIITYLLKKHFGIINYQDIFYKFIIKEKSINELGLDKIKISDKKWKNAYIPIFSEMYDFEFIKEYTTINEKVLGIICTFMQGLPEIDDLKPKLDKDEKNFMFQVYKQYFDNDKVNDLLGINIDLIKTNADVEKFVDKLESELYKQNLDSIVNQRDKDVYEDITDSLKENLGIQLGDFDIIEDDGEDVYDDAGLFDLNDDELVNPDNDNLDEEPNEDDNDEMKGGKKYYENLHEYIKNNLIGPLKSSLNPINTYPITWGDGSLIPFTASELYEITICLHQITYDQTIQYYKLTNCTISDIMLLKNSNDLIPRKLLFHDFTIKGHFDAIVDRNHISLNKDEVINKKLTE